MQRAGPRAWDSCSFLWLEALGRKATGDWSFWTCLPPNQDALSSDLVFFPAGYPIPREEKKKRREEELVPRKDHFTLARLVFFAQSIVSKWAPTKWPFPKLSSGGRKGTMEAPYPHTRGGLSGELAATVIHRSSALQ